MFGNFKEDARKVLVIAEKEMMELKHPYVGSEHLLLAILKSENSVSKKLKEYNLDYNKLRNEIIDKNIYDLMYKKDNLKAIDNLINDNKSYKEENDKKDQYIKNLERYVEELKTDNTNKQKHIDDLENELNKKTKRRFFK